MHSEFTKISIDTRSEFTYNERMSTATENVRIHVRIDEIKAAKGIQDDAEFARLTGIRQSTISDIRTGRQKSFGAEDKKKLHLIFGLTPNDIEEFVSA